MSKTPYYNYNSLLKGLYAMLDLHGREDMKEEGLKVLQILQHAAAVEAFGYRHTNPELSEVEALAWAYEDVQVALSGHGNNTLTGIILDYWKCFPVQMHDQVFHHLNWVSITSNEKTEIAVQRRYLLQYRIHSVARPGEFSKPHVLPTFGRATRRWLGIRGFDPDEAEAMLTRLEQLERDGVIRLTENGIVRGDNAPPRGSAPQPKKPSLRLVEKE